MYNITPDYITTEDILKRVSQEDIWEHYLGYLPGPGERFSSPFRTDTTPSANLFYTDSGKLLYKDFGDGSMNCWQFVQKLYKLDFKNSLLKIWNDLVLEEKKSSSEILIKKHKKSSAVIQIKKRDFIEEDLKFWGKYEITKEILNEYSVVPITYYWINGNMYKVHHLLSYSYEYGNGIRKLYFPKNTSNGTKFISNAKANIVVGYNHLPEKGDLLIITKSHKDVMVYKRLGYYSISPQGEGIDIPENILNSLKKRFKNIILNYDNDEAGRKNAERISSITSSTNCFDC